MTALTQLVTDLLSITTLFFTFAMNLMIPKLNTLGTGYDVTLIHVAIWVPIFLGLFGAAAGGVRKLWNSRKSR